MRMWGISPSLLCRKHLLGSHVELHMLVGCINKNKSLKGYISQGLIEIHSIEKSHEEIAEEMKKRNYNHNSPLPNFIPYISGKINIDKSMKDLYSRCEECRKLQEEEIK